VRILFVNSARGLGGGTTTAPELAISLADRGHEVTVVCHPKSPIRDRLTAHSHVRIAPVAIRAELNPLRVLQLARLLRAFPADVVLADRRKDVKFSFAATRLQPGSALVHRHGAPSTLRDSTLYRAVWSRIDGIIVNSHAMARQLAQRTPWISATPMHVVHNGKNLEVYRPRPELRYPMRAALGLADDAMVVAFHGAFSARKNIDVLIRALALRPVGSRLHALLIGEGESLPSLEALARRYGVPVTFAGRRSDVPQVLAAADLYVHLSSAEGFSNSVIEALACGLPVIASQATSHGEQIEDGVCGYLVPLRDDKAVLAAILRLASDTQLRARMALAARHTAEQRFNLDRMVAGYESALRAAARHYRETTSRRSR
jgi:glycosyltransferase involved in cell wall biosynthesis